MSRTTFALSSDAEVLLDRLAAMLAAGAGDAAIIAEARQFFEVETDKEAIRHLAVLSAVACGADTVERVEGFVLGMKTSRAVDASATVG